MIRNVMIATLALVASVSLVACGAKQDAKAADCATEECAVECDTVEEAAVEEAAVEDEVAEQHAEDVAE